MPYLLFFGNFLKLQIRIPRPQHAFRSIPIFRRHTITGLPLQVKDIRLSTATASEKIEA